MYYVHRSIIILYHAFSLNNSCNHFNKDEISAKVLGHCYNICMAMIQLFLFSIDFDSIFEKISISILMSIFL